MPSWRSFYGCCSINARRDVYCISCWYTEWICVEILKTFRIGGAQTIFEIFLHYGHYRLNECKLFSPREPLWILSLCFSDFWWVNVYFEFASSKTYSPHIKSKWPRTKLKPVQALEPRIRPGLRSLCDNCYKAPFNTNLWNEMPYDTL